MLEEAALVCLGLNLKFRNVCPGNGEKQIVLIRTASRPRLELRLLNSMQASTADPNLPSLAKFF
jgi:hypothetical protein